MAYQLLHLIVNHQVSPSSYTNIYKTLIDTDCYKIGFDLIIQ